MLETVVRMVEFLRSDDEEMVNLGILLLRSQLPKKTWSTFLSCTLNDKKKIDKSLGWDYEICRWVWVIDGDDVIIREATIWDGGSGYSGWSGTGGTAGTATTVQFGAGILIQNVTLHTYSTATYNYTFQRSTSTTLNYHTMPNNYPTSSTPLIYGTTAYSIPP